MYEEPELVHAMMTLLTDTYTAFMNKWYEICPMNPGINVHWASIRHKGTILLRDDSAMNLSPELYEEFAAPYDGELLKRFGGGAVHFCGRGDHYIETLTSLPGLTGINLSQPELNDMEKIYRCTVDRGIKILAFNRNWAQKDKARGFGGNLHA
jgi:uroporphyrinogen-III decarboxylase